MIPLPDIQNSRDKRGLRLPKVGIIHFHFGLYTAANITTQASADAYVSLNASSRGINMSRIGEAILEVNASHAEDTRSGFTTFIGEILNELTKRLTAHDAYVKIKFPLLVDKEAPISKKVGPAHYEVTLEGIKKNKVLMYYLSVQVQYISCCSCSKALSEHLACDSKHGAPHNQRSFADVTIELNPKKELLAVQLIELIEKAVYTLPYPIIKRADEQEVARRSWEFTQFVEDSSRNIGLALNKDPRIADWLVVVTHMESIHQHEATAVLYKGKKGGLR